MTSSLVFTVKKQQPILVAPAEPTPKELKPLSDIDDQEALRFHISGIHIYRGDASSTTDPAKLVREGLAKALVYYYPFAGRLREGPGRKLLVDCTGEGAVFLEADADVRLDQLGPEPQPPFPCLEKLIHGVDEPPSNFLTSPLLTIQVTRLACGGFIVAHRVNHTVADAAGGVQFLKAVGELARGASSPSVTPVWARELLSARDPPHVTYEHPEYDQLPAEPPLDGPAAVRSFFFGSREIAAIRQHLPPHVHATRFEVLTACLWRCRTTALGTPTDEEVRARFILNARHRCDPPLPEGFYGNAIVYPVARTTAGELRRRPLSYAVELVRAAKDHVMASGDYLQSVADLLVIRGRPLYTVAQTYRISDLTRLGFEDVDYGFGPAVYSGPAVGGGRVTARAGSNYIMYRNSKGEDGILVPVSLPEEAMKRFEREIERMIIGPPSTAAATLVLPRAPPQLVADA